MDASRRSFLKNCAALGAVEALGWGAWAQEPGAGETLPEWNPGELDVHFIYTGCGENTFLRLPDGTALLNDVGEFYRPEALDEVPLLPSAARLGGEWVSRYLKRVYHEREIDYAVFSHWHSDHIGHSSWNKAETPKAAFRFRTLPDGRKVNGFLCVAEDFKIRQAFDHQYPARGTYNSQDDSMELLDGWEKEQLARGLKLEPFRVGALNQIALRRDPAKYAGKFSIRNVCANGVLWDGADGARDFAAEHCAATGKKSISQNTLSLGFVVQYGKFRYWAGGDVNQRLTGKDGAKMDYEGEVGRRVGAVSLCKMNHHGCADSMHDGFVRAVRAQAYVCGVWCPRQLAPETFDRLAATPAAADGKRPLILPNLVCTAHRKAQAKNGYDVRPLGGVHVVAKVLPGGDRFRVYLLDAADERMRVVAKFEREA